MHRVTLQAIRTLVNRRCFGGKHMRFGLLRRQWRNEPRHVQRQVLDELERCSWVLWKPSLGERHLSLDAAAVREIAAALERL